MAGEGRNGLPFSPVVQAGVGPGTPVALKPSHKLLGFSTQ